MMKLKKLVSGRIKYSLVIACMAFVSCSPGKNAKTSEFFSPTTVLKLSPSDGNPRNSEGDFVSLNDGRILFVYTRYYGDSSSDHAPALLSGRYSDDGGKTWTNEDEIILENEGTMNVMSVSLLRLQNGDIALFYLRKNSTEDCLPMLRVSKDDGKSWSEAISCIRDKEGYFVLNNNRVIQLESGRLLMPVALHNVPGGEWSNKAALYCYFSDDNGETWYAGSQVPDHTDIITQEPGLIEMKDGRVMMYIRASGGFQQLSYSSDEGETWSEIEKSNIVSPLSPASMVKVPNSDDWLLVWNNNDGSDPNIKNKRTPLTAAISKDEGKTWKYLKNIQDDPDGWYCYTAIHFVDDNNVLLGYCAGSQLEKTHLSITDVTLFDINWLFDQTN